jgi:arginine/lysine/ornithine decarboxylase
MHPPVMPMVLLGLIMREEFVDYLAAEEERVLYGTGMEQPRGILQGSLIEDIKRSRILQDAKEPAR